MRKALDAAEREGRAVPAEYPLRAVSSERPRANWATPFLNCVRTRVHLSWEKFVGHGYMYSAFQGKILGKGLCSSLDAYSEALSIAIALKTRGCVLHEQWNYGTQNVGTHMKLLTVLRIHDERATARKRCWVGE